LEKPPDYRRCVTPMQSYQDILSEILIDQATLQARIEELGAEISRDYQGADLLLICILRGGLVFMVDLMRHITVPHQIDFMAVSSYGAGARQSGGSVRLSLDLKTDIRDKDVLLVPIDYCGFTIPNKFVFGFGLDLDEYYRNLPFIAVVDTTKYQPPEEN
jgi:hypoxanthine phosphoribosyltransferase